MSSKKLAFVFPGQGSQKVGMLAEMATKFNAINETFALAAEVLGYDLWQIAQNGPKEKLDQTEFTQPILLCAEVALYRVWMQSERERPAFMAGHSLGEYSALVCAEAIDFAEALRLVSLRAKLMQQAVPAGKGGMAAIIGLSNEVIDAICANASVDEQIVAAANYNSIGQTVVSGNMQAVVKAVELAKESGAKLAVVLPVSVPSHSILMRPAAEKLAVELAKIAINVPKVAVLHNATVESYEEPELIRKALVEQLYLPVRWVDIINKLAELGVDRVYECGPGKVLAGLIKRIDSRIGMI